MARKIVTVVTDDIDGGAAEGTVRFALDGTEYEIDLNGPHRDDLHEIFRPYVEHGRKVKVGGSARRRNDPVLDTTAIRNWARENGYDIKDRGRVPADLVAKYQEATGK